MLTERPPLSSIWSNEPGKIYIGAKLFGVGVSHNLFNRISVKLDGRDAIELPRGTAGNFQPIDRSQLQTGNVYFRIIVEQTDANQQTEVDALEIVDNVLRPLGTVALGQDVIEEQELVVRETSINPAYAGTADESRESTWTVSFSRNLSGPPGQGWRSRCEFSFPPAFSQTSRSGLPGARVGYSFSSSRCKRLGVLRDGVRSNVIELATDADRMAMCVSTFHRMHRRTAPSSSRYSVRTCSSAFHTSTPRRWSRIRRPQRPARPTTVRPET